MSRITPQNIAIRPSFLSEKDAKPALVGCDLVERFTGDVIGTVYAGDGRDAVDLAGAFAAVPQLVFAAQEALLQIEHLHSKFQPTGSGESVLQKLRSALSQVERPDFVFDNEEEKRLYADVVATGKAAKP